MDEKMYKETWEEIDIYTTELHQGTIIIGEGSSIHHKIIEDYCKHLISKEKVAYIDFAKLKDMKGLAESFLAQYSLLFSDAPKYYNPDDSTGLLDFSINLFSEIENTEVMYIWLDNFTEVESWEESYHVYRVLRSLFQEQQEIVHIFTSQKNEECHKIFLNYDNPFYRFAVPIKLFPREDL